MKREPYDTTANDNRMLAAAEAMQSAVNALGAAYREFVEAFNTASRAAFDEGGKQASETFLALISLQRLHDELGAALARNGLLPVLVAGADATGSVQFVAAEGATPRQKTTMVGSVDDFAARWARRIQAITR